MNDSYGAIAAPQLTIDFDGPAKTPLEVLRVLERKPFRTSSAYVEEACTLAQTQGWAAKDGDAWHMTVRGYAALRWMGAYTCSCGWSTARHLGSPLAITGSIRAWLHQQRCDQARDLFA
jgi:hypothetical protein